MRLPKLKGWEYYVGITVRRMIVQPNAYRNLKPEYTFIRHQYVRNWNFGYLVVVGYVFKHMPVANR